jgi:hypothetical protein
VAKDSHGNDGKLNFMDVISILSLVFGDSPEYGLMRQPMSSSCFTKDAEALCGYEEDQEKKGGRSTNQR